MDATAIFGFLFRLLYPIIIIVTGIILYVILNNRNKPSLLAIAFIVYGIIDTVAFLIFFLAVMNVRVVSHSGLDTLSYISMMNAISSIVSMIALIIFVVLVIVGVNKILESEVAAPPPYSR